MVGTIAGSPMPLTPSGLMGSRPSTMREVTRGGARNAVPAQRSRTEIGVAAQHDVARLLCCHTVDRGVAMGLDDNLDGVLDPLAGVTQRGRQVFQREGV